MEQLRGESFDSTNRENALVYSHGRRSNLRVVSELASISQTV